MNRTLIAAALVAAAVPASVALAGPVERGDAGRGGDRVAERAAAREGAARQAGRARGPALVARGTIGTLDAAAGSFTMELRGGNRPLRRIAGEATSLTVTLDIETAVDRFTTKIRAKGRGRASVTDLKVGDRVVVNWRAGRGTTVAQLAGVEAKRVVARTPAPATSPAPAPAPDGTAG